MRAAVPVGRAGAVCFAALIALLSCGVAVAQAPPPARQWEVIYDRGGEQIAVDAASLRRDGDTVEAWLRGRPVPSPDNPLRWLIVHALYDCRRSTEITLSLEGLDENQSSLGVVDIPANERRPQPMGDGDDQERAIMRRVCGTGGGAVA